MAKEKEDLRDSVEVWKDEGLNKNWLKARATEFRPIKAIKRRRKRDKQDAAKTGRKPIVAGAIRKVKQIPFAAQKSLEIATSGGTSLVDDISGSAGKTAREGKKLAGNVKTLKKLKG